MARRQLHPPAGHAASGLDLLEPARVVERPAPPPDLAGLGERFGAALLDLLVLSTICLAAQFVTGFVVPRPTTPDALVAYASAMLVVSAAVSLLALVYYTLGNRTSQTLGKRLVGTRVVHYRTRERLGWGRSFLRALMLFVLALPAGLGFLSVLGPERRGWHDLAANSIVVRAPERAPTPH